MRKNFLIIFCLFFALFGWSITSANETEFNNYAKKLSEKDIILQNSDYRILDNITRAELAKLAINSVGQTPNFCSGEVFGDVNNSLGDLCGYIEKAFEMQKISKRNGFFEPNKNISRGEAAKIFFSDKNVDIDNHKYSDESEIDATFVDSIKKWITLGCISRLEKFRPNDSVTRGEAFKMASCITFGKEEIKQENLPAPKIIGELADSPIITVKCAGKWAKISIFTNSKEIYSQECSYEGNIHIPLKDKFPIGLNKIFYENNLDGKILTSPEIAVENWKERVNYGWGGWGGWSSSNNSGNNSNPTKTEEPKKPEYNEDEPPKCIDKNNSSTSGTNSSNNQIDYSIKISEPLKKALATGDASLVTKEEIIEGLKKLTKRQQHSSNDLYKTVFELNDDLTENENSLVDLQWNTDRSTGIFTILNSAGQFKPLFVTNNGSLNVGIAGQISENSRALLLGRNPFYDNVMNDQMKKALKNAILWTISENQNGQTCKIEEPQEMEIVLANVVDDNIFKNWLLRYFPDAKINANNACDGDKLESCITENTKLLVLSADLSCNANSMRNTLQIAKERWIWVFYISNHLDQRPCTTEVLKMYELSYPNDGNYWTRGTLNWKQTPTSPQETKLLEIIEKIEADNFDNSWIEACRNKWRDCSNATLQNQYRNEIDNLRNVLRNLDSTNSKLFVNENPDIARLMILLGDKYREEIEYPVNLEDEWAKWYKTYFANSTVYNNRGFTTVEQNLGNFVTKKVWEIVPQNITLTAKTVNKEYAPGIYVWPGQKVTITRTDSSDATAKVFINILRNATRIYNVNGYARPQFIKTPEFSIAPNETIELSNPYGGPLYFSIPKVNSDTELSFKIEWAGTHPVITDPSNEDEVNKFIEDIKTTQAEWVVVATEFVMIHSRLDHWNASINNNRYKWDMKAFFNDIWNYLIYNTYSIAGFNNGSSLMPTDKVQAYCDKFGIDCLSKIHQLPERIQHAVSDKVSMCGDLCSGNPYETTAPFGAISWGDAHEIGHNLQNWLIMIYGNKSRENSNNIFPYAIFQKFNETAPANMEIRHLNRLKWKNTPQAFQWIKEWLAKDTPEAQKAYIKEAIWTVSNPGEGIYEKNSERYSFFVNLAHFMKYYNPDKTDKGWEVWSMMYIMMREFHNKRWNDAIWNENKAKLWFDLYSRAETNNVDGNDFMLITSSKIIGKDMRPVFDMWWIDYKDKASEQVASMNLTPADKFFFPMYNYPRYYQGENPILMTADAEYTYGIDYQP